jgi:DNA-binding FadR family transcriptional regulator
MGMLDIATIKDAILEPLEDSSRQSAITRRLHQAIMLGLFEDGGQLPSESDLAAQLSVSTVTLRSALAELRSIGLVETKRGRGGGNFVRIPPARGVAPAMSILEQYNIDDIRDMRDYAGVVSGGIARLAAERIRKASLDRLEASARAIAKCSSPIEKAHADLWFHMELAAATRSAKLTKAELGIQIVMAPLIWIPAINTLPVKQAMAQHLQILEALARKDPDAAQRSSEAHVHHAFNRLIEFRMQLTDEVPHEEAARD